MHGELVPLAASTGTTYKVKGYAYSGMLAAEVHIIFV